MNSGRDDSVRSLKGETWHFNEDLRSLCTDTEESRTGAHRQSSTIPNSTLNLTPDRVAIRTLSENIFVLSERFFLCSSLPICVDIVAGIYGFPGQHAVTGNTCNKRDSPRGIYPWKSLKPESVAPRLLDADRQGWSSIIAGRINFWFSRPIENWDTDLRDWNRVASIYRTHNTSNNVNLFTIVGIVQ